MVFWGRALRKTFDLSFFRFAALLRLCIGRHDDTCISAYGPQSRNDIFLQQHYA